MPHLCRACLVYCIDFRFHRALEAFLHDQGLDKDGTDIVQLAGAAKSLAHMGEGAGGEFLLEQIQISQRLHGVRQIYLVNHEDCGAYGLEDEVDSEEELTTHRKDLRTARTVLEEHFPGAEILTYFMHLNGKPELIE